MIKSIEILMLICFAVMCTGFIFKDLYLIVLGICMGIISLIINEKLD